MPQKGLKKEDGVRGRREKISSKFFPFFPDHKSTFIGNRANQIILPLFANQYVSYNKPVKDSLTGRIAQKRMFFKSVKSFEYFRKVPGMLKDILHGQSGMYANLPYPAEVLPDMFPARQDFPPENHIFSSVPEQNLRSEYANP